MARFLSSIIFIVVLSILIVYQLDIVFGFVCPEKDIEGGCKHADECIYADPDNCYGFIQCTDWGKVIRKQCNHGLQWNDKIKNCDHQRHSTCRRRPRF